MKKFFSWLLMLSLLLTLAMPAVSVVAEETIEYKGPGIVYRYSPSRARAALLNGYLVQQGKPAQLGAKVTWNVVVENAVGDLAQCTVRIWRQELSDTTNIYTSYARADNVKNQVSFTFSKEGRYFLQLLVEDGAGAKIEYQTAPITIKQVDPVAEKVKEIVAQCASSGTDFEKAKNLHDWLTANAVYDYTYTKYNAEDVLFNGSGVCEAFTRAYQLLLSEAGIDSAQVRGQAGGGPHTWNAVLLDGEWYHVDVTWDLNFGHAYFGLTTALISRDHTIEGSTPSATATRYNILLNSCDGSFSNFGQVASLMKPEKAKSTLYYLGAEANWGALIRDYHTANAQNLNWFIASNDAFTIDARYCNGFFGNVEELKAAIDNLPQAATEFYLGFKDTSAQAQTNLDAVLNLLDLYGSDATITHIYQSTNGIYYVRGTHAHVGTDPLPPVVTRIPGDADNDHNVGMNDVMLMLRYAVGMDVTINTANADVDADGAVGMNDVMLVLKYSVGYDVVLK